jgi:hypothetical protein
MKFYSLSLQLLFLMLGITIFAKDVIPLANHEKIKAHDSREFIFTLKDAETRQIRLYVDARFDWKTLGGYTGGMKITINGQAVTGSRLLNKPLKFKTRNGSRSKWAKPESKNFVIMYAGNFSNAITTNKHYIYSLIEKNQHPFRFVFDLSGMAQHVGKNKLVIHSTHNVGLVIENVRLEINEHAMPRINDPSTLIKPAPTGPLKDCLPKTPTKINLSVNISDNGAMKIKVNDNTFTIESKLSLPNGKWLYLKDGAKWQNLQKGNNFEFIRSSPEYQLKRKIEIKSDHVKIYDTFINLRNKITGVMFENIMHLPEKPLKILRHGIETELARISSSTNPTISAKMNNFLAGLVAEDDILRNQNYFKKETQAIILGDKSLGLPPKGSHTLEWSIYILPGGSYYDFINAVRRNWNSNFTWEGPLAFPRSKKITDWNVRNVTPAFIKNYLAKYPVKLVMTHLATSPRISRKRSTIENPWIGHGTAIPQFTWWYNRTKALVKVMEKVAPKVKVYAYIHKNICTEPGFPNKYRDSVALQNNINKQRGRFIPTPNNSYGKALKKVYQYIVDNLNANIYMDEICLSVTRWAPYKEWDKCTVQISPSNHKVIKKLSIPNLLTKPWLENMIQYLKDHNKELLANGPPATRTLQNHHVLHFVEEGMGETGLIAAHLSTPLAWNGYTMGQPGYKLLQNSLNFGALAITWSGIWSDHLFPFTPIELHSGYLIGKERIITNRSGRFGWGDNSRAEVYIYNGNGELTIIPGVKETSSGNKVFTEIRMPSDHMAVLVRSKNAKSGKVVSLSTEKKLIKLEITNKNWGKQTQIKDKNNLCLKLNGGRYLTAKPFFEADKEKEYTFSMTAKSFGEKRPTLLFGVVCFDKNKIYIPTIAVNTVNGTATILSTDVKAGSKTVVIKNGNKWKASGYVAFNTDNSDKFRDLPNRNLSSKITKIIKKDNTWIITLQKPIKKSYPAGTKIRLHKAGNSYLYLVNSKIPAKWTTYKKTIKGILKKGFSSRSFKPGTKFFRVLCFIIGGKGKDCFTLIKDVQIETKDSKIIKTKILKVNFNKCQNK